MTPSTIGDDQQSDRESCCDSSLCHDSLLFDTLQCTTCLQPPAFAKQCPSCHVLVCGDCLLNSANCITCSNSKKTVVKYADIKDKILKQLLESLIRFKHKCTNGEPTKIFSQSEMTLHKNNHDCPSKKFKCFCQGANDTFRYSYEELMIHLTVECDSVKIHCYFCQH